MNCPSCSAALKPGARFCAECGATVPQAPAYTDKTMIASPLPPSSERTAPMNVGQQYGPPAPQPQYGQPAQPQYGQPAQPQYGQPAQPQYGQPQYGPPAPQAYAQAGNPYGYNVPAQAPVSPSKGFISGLIMLLSSLAMAAAIFLPFLGDSSEMFTMSNLLSRLSEFGVDELPGEAWLFITIPAVIGLAVLSSGLALWRRRNVWAVFSLLFGLVMFGFMGLLMIGAAASEESDFAVGSGVPVMMVSGLVLFITSIVFMATRKLPR